MKKIAIIALLAAGSALVYACNGDNTQNDGGTDANPSDTGTPDTANNDAGTDSGLPPPPVLKTQLDRIGRPAINTALNHVFDQPDAGTAGPAKDSYNANATPSNWTTSYTGQFVGNLAVYDSLDSFVDGGAGSGCGNQAAYNKITTPSPYAALAGLTADDQLYLNTASTTCKQYLGVELNAVAILPNSDCGGRTLSEDVIDTTYGAVAGTDTLSVNDAGVLVSAATDGIGPVAAKTNGTTFPYLATPQ